MWKKLMSLFDAKMWKFLLVGIVNTLFGTAVMFGLYNLLQHQWPDATLPADTLTWLPSFLRDGLIEDWQYWVASAANYILGSILSYFLNKYFTFQYKKRSLRVVVRFVINISVCYLIAYGAAKPLVRLLLQNYSGTVQDNVAMLVGMGLFVGLNYLGQRLFAFREEPAETGENDANLPQT